MSFFDTIKDEIKKEHQEKYGIPKKEPEINSLTEPPKENVSRIHSTSIDFLREQAKKYTEEPAHETEPEPETHIFERPQPEVQEIQRPKPEDPVVLLLKEIRDQNREILMVLKEIRNRGQGPSPAPERRFY